MEITSIGKENLEYFEPFTGGPLAPNESALGLIHEDAAIGALVLSEKEAVCTIESIFVVPEYRRKGGGTLLLKALTECGQEIGIKDFLIFYGEDEIMTAFLRKTGFTCLPKGGSNEDLHR